MLARVALDEREQSKILSASCDASSDHGVDLLAECLSLGQVGLVGQERIWCESQYFLDMVLKFSEMQCGRLEEVNKLLGMARFEARERLKSVARENGFEEGGEARKGLEAA